MENNIIIQNLIKYIDSELYNELEIDLQDDYYVFDDLNDEFFAFYNI